MTNKLSRKNWISSIHCCCRKWYLFRLWYTYVCVFRSTHSTAYSQMMRKAVTKNSNLNQINDVFVPFHRVRTHVLCFLSYSIKMENKLVLQTFSFGNSIFGSLNIRFEGSFRRLLFSLCQTINTNEVIDPWRYNCDSVILYLYMVNAYQWHTLHMCLQWESMKFPHMSYQMPWHRCWCQRMVTVKGKLLEVAERNQQRITFFLFFCLL